MKRLRVLTANLFNGRAEPMQFGRLLDRVRPDVVAVQELAPNVAPEIARRFRFRDLDPRLDRLGLGIGSRMPAGFGVVPMVNRSARFATIRGERTSVELVNVHLLNPLQFPWTESVRGRTEQLAAMRQFLAGRPGGPRLIVGDMNASPAWPAYRVLAETFEDLVVKASVRNGARPEPTWAYRDGLPRLLRIDHVFGTAVEPVHAEIVRVVGSDHAGVIVDLDIAGER